MSGNVPSVTAFRVVANVKSSSAHLKWAMLLPSFQDRCYGHCFGFIEDSKKASPTRFLHLVSTMIQIC